MERRKSSPVSQFSPEIFLRQLRDDLPHLAKYGETAALSTDLPNGLLDRVGDTLGRLIPPSVADALCEISSGEACIRLRVSASDRVLHGLPWEFARIAGLPNGAFLGLQPRISLLRDGSLADESETLSSLPPLSHLPIHAPIRVLLARANPSTPRHPFLTHLRGEAESILTALRQSGRGAEGSILVEEIRHATPAALRAALAENRPHIFHFIGHGEARPTGGLLVLHGERAGNHAYVYADELADWLRGDHAEPIPLTVLSACWSGSPGRGVAEILMRRRASTAIMAMQLPLRDSAAERLARTFYDMLAGDSSATIEDAVAAARQSVRGVGPDWGVPVLYQAEFADDTPLFPKRTENTSAVFTPPVVARPSQSALRAFRGFHGAGRLARRIALGTCQKTRGTHRHEWFGENPSGQ